MVRRSKSECQAQSHSTIDYQILMTLQKLSYILALQFTGIFLNSCSRPNCRQAI